jgi:hypothetical protein
LAHQSGGDGVTREEGRSVTTRRHFPKLESPSYARKEKSVTGGTQIDITDLLPTVKEQFASKGFNTLLLEKMSRAFALFLKAGLSITVNGHKPKPDVPDLAESNDLRPIRHMLKKDGVDILIMAGLSPHSDRTPRGWYIFCNGRMVLDADKTEKTGWGAESQPGFHVKFNHFLGYVYFRSKDLWKLPWTTTKDGVDRESPIYQVALSEMRVQSRPVLQFINTFYEEGRELSQPEHAVFAKAKAVPPLAVAKRHNTNFQATIKTPKAHAVVSIQSSKTGETGRRCSGKTKLVSVAYRRTDI